MANPTPAFNSRPTNTFIDFKLGRYECVESGHNKFWECLHYSSSSTDRHAHRFLIRWGRIGAKKPQNMFVEGVYALEHKIREKLGKGYKHIPGTPVTSQEYDKMLIERELAKTAESNLTQSSSKKSRKM